jgi:hypothetical protein
VLYSGVVLDGGISLRDGQELIGQPGSSKALPIISNTSAASNDGHGVRLGSNNSITNLHISGVYNSAVIGEDVGNLSIQNSLITGFGLSEQTVFVLPTLFRPGGFAEVGPPGIGIESSADVRIRVSETEIRDGNGTSIGIGALSGHADIEIEYVTVRDQNHLADAEISPGISVASVGVSSVDLKVQNTSVSNIGAGLSNSDGLALVALESSTMKVFVDEYSYLNPDGDGGGSATGMEMGVFFGTGASFEGTVKNSHIQGSTSTGIQVLDQAPGGSNQVIAHVHDNEVHDSVVGIQLALGFGAANGTSMMTIDSNLVVNPSFAGIHFINGFEQQTFVDLLIQRNTVMNALFGLRFEQGVGGSVASLNLDAGLGRLGSQGRNRIIGSQAADIYVEAFDCCGFPPTPTFTVEAANNWWGSDTGPAQVIEAGGATVDVTPFLTEDPGDD